MWHNILYSFVINVEREKLVDIINSSANWTIEKVWPFCSSRYDPIKIYTGFNLSHVIAETVEAISYSKFTLLEHIYSFALLHHCFHANSNNFSNLICSISRRCSNGTLGWKEHSFWVWLNLTWYTKTRMKLKKKIWNMS